MLAGSRYLMMRHLITKKQDLKSNELKRAWAAWDIAFDNWEKEMSLVGYRKGDTYKLLEDGRNMAFTIMDNDGPYLKLFYQFMNAWEKVKEEDKYLK